MHSTVQPVSISDSPFSMLDEVAVTSVVTAPSALAANSNEVRVRVEGFVEEQHHALAVQQLRRPVRIHAPRQRQDGLDLFGRKLVDAQQRTQMASLPSGVRSTNSTLSAPSLSCSFTSMISSGVV